MMDKKALLAIVLSFGIWMGWQKLYLEPFQQKALEEQKTYEAARQASLQKAAPSIESSATKTSIAPVSNLSSSSQEPSKNASVSKADFKVNVTNGNSLLDDWVLSNYSKSIDNRSDQISLEYVTGYAKQLSLRFVDASFTDLNDKNWSNFQEKNGSISAELNNSEASISRNFAVHSTDYYGDLTYHFHFNGTPPKYIFLDLAGSPKRPHDKEGSIFGQIPDKVRFSFRDGTQRKTIIASALKETFESSAGVKWFGIDSRYFVFAVSPDRAFRDTTGIQIAKEFSNGVEYVRGSVVIPTDGKQDFSFPLKVYFGPKRIENLEAADPIFSDTIDFGWTTPIAIPILKALKWLYEYVKNYGLSIIILTFLIKVLLFPLTYKSMTSMAKMAKLQPQLNVLREKYKNDKEKLNTEMLSFMKTNGYNPVGGCLPTLLQMPIFFSLYRVFFNSMELYQAPFVGWIHDLSAPDPLFVAPVLLAGLMFLQQRLSPNTATDPAQQKMMQFMPLMFGLFMFFLPAGLNIYMVVNSVTSITQQYILNRRFGLYPRTKATVTPVA